MAIRVLHLLRSDRFSGAENVVCQIMKAFSQDAGIDMVYCSPEGKIRRALQERALPFLPLEQFTPAAVRKAAKQYDATMIHAHDAAAAVTAALATKGTLPILAHVHANHENMRVVSAKSLLFRYCAKRFFHIFWVSDSSLCQYRFARSVQEKSEVLYNVIDLDDLHRKITLDPEEYAFDIVYVGRLSYQKNPCRLMEVLANVKTQLPHVRMAVVGDGELGKEVLCKAKELQLTENVTFMGFMKNPLKLMSMSKVMLMTSRYEGLPICALEAMGLGIPIVSTPTDGLQELVDDGINGFLRDQNDALSDCLVTLIREDAIRNQFSDNFRQKALQWNDLTIFRETLRKQYESI
ncbi:MAG TPA: glycosyltransferase [Clostridiales bacterium]|jgi:glycosyltransferase involved in cell wall biosynthesis|nr:glycosyltransferase [Clostridiales bacterium]